MKALQATAALGSFILLTTLLMWMFGHVALSPMATGGLVRLAGMLGIYGDERIEDLYLILTVTLSILIAGGLTYVVYRHRHSSESTRK